MNTAQRLDIERVLRDVIRRRDRGEPIADESVCECNPQLMPDLARELARLQKVVQARAAAERMPLAGGVESDIFTDSPVEWPTKNGDSPYRIGPFQLLRRVGEGGFGTVWAARDTRLDRLVAVKIPHRGSLSADQAERILREARAASGLHHPNIVTVYEVGHTEQLTYIVSELVHGVSLADWADGSVEPLAAARLVEAIARAVHYAHEHGIIHRDLKPTNILIDADDEPHIVDFGLAKRELSDTLPSMSGCILGTPAYMSPEQARAEPGQCSRTSDVYSLGVILFELLTSEIPFRGSPHVVLRKILEEDPPRPRQLATDIPMELDAICLKCLEKKGGNRYPTAEELANDLARYVRGEPVLARPPRLWRRLAKWSMRRPGLAAAVALLMILSIAGPLIAWQQTTLAANLRLAERSAESKSRLAEGLADQERAARRQAEDAHARTRRLLYAADMDSVSQAIEAYDFARARQLLLAHLPDADQPDQRGFEWYHWWQQTQNGLRQSVAATGEVVCLALSADECHLAVGTQHSGIEILTQAEQQFTRRNLVPDAWPLSMALSGNGQILYVGHANGLLNCWDTNEAKLLHSIPAHNGRVNATVCSPDDQLLTCGSDGQVKVWDPTLTKVLASLELDRGSTCHDIGVSPDGRWLAIFGESARLPLGVSYATVQVFDRLTLKERHKWILPKCTANRLRFSPDSRLLGAAAGENAPRVWNVDTGEQLPTLAGTSERIHGLVFDPTSTRVTGFASRGGGAYLWNVHDGMIEPFLAYQPHIIAADWGPKSRCLFTGGFDRTVRVWAPDRRSHSQRLVGQLGNIDGCFVSSDGTTLVTNSTDKSTATWDLSTRTLRSLHRDRLDNITVSPDGTWLAGIEGKRTLVVRSLRDAGPKRSIYTSNGGILCLRFSPCGQRLAVGEEKGDSNGSRIFDVARGDLVQQLPSPGNAIHALEFNPQATELYVVRDWDYLDCWDLTRTSLRSSRSATERTIPYGMNCLHRIGTDRLAIGSGEGVWLVNVPSGRILHQFMSFGQGVNHMVLLPDQRTLAVAMGNYDSRRDSRRGVRLWDIETGQSKGMLATGHGSVLSLAVTADGQTLVTGHLDGRVMLWNAARSDDVAVGWGGWLEK